MVVKIGEVPGHNRTKEIQFKEARWDQVWVYLGISWPRTMAVAQEERVERTY